MKSRSLVLMAQLCVASMVPLAAGCGDDDETGPTSPLEGSWVATSFTAPDIGDVIDQGMTLRIDLEDDASYLITVTGDLVDLCDPGPNCTADGFWTGTSTNIILDPGTVDAVTFTFVISGDTMTWTGSINGIPVTIVFEEA